MEVLVVSIVGWMIMGGIMFVQQRAWSKERIEMLNRIQDPMTAVAESIKAPPGAISYVDETSEYKLQEADNGKRA